MQVSGANVSVGSHYLCRFGGGDAALGDPTVVNATYAQLENRLDCYAPPTNASGFAPPDTVVVDVSLNGQDYSASDVRFTYYPPALPTEACPTTGPVHAPQPM